MFAESPHRASRGDGAEDFSFFAEKVPGLYIALAGRSPLIRADQAPGHRTPESAIDDSGLGVGGRAITAMALHYMTTSAAAVSATP